MHAAQASDNVPARYDRARLRRPTTPLPGRGRPIGLEADLSVTAAEPATEMPSVAAGAPARAVAILPTYLHHCLRRLADGSRPPTPEGSLPSFPWGDVATPIRPATGRPSLPPSSSTRSPIGSPYGSLSPRGGLRAYHVAPPKPHGLGPASTAVARRLRRGSSEPPDLATYLLVQACQHLGLVLGGDAYGGSPGLTIPRTPGPQPPWCWQSQPWLAPQLPSRRMRVRCTGGSAPPRCQGRAPR
jgi:hypothetical protein